MRLCRARKTISCTRSEDRDRQFKGIRRACGRFERQGLPIISVDTKKREMIGLFKNPGAKWAKAATPVNDHDFRKDAVGVAVSYGIYDSQANRGHLFVCTSHDTSEFAGDALALWWNQEGRDRYPHANRILILADCGGSNGNRVAAWKCALQEKLCDAFGLSVTVAHYPPGASKWNPIEHRLFSEVSKNWAGHPLTSYETMLKYIRTTETKHGLSVRATLLKRTYPTGRKPAAEQLSRLNLRPQRTLPAWNYTVAPAREM
ncbi:MAG: ISAzo13 family transposase [Nitrospiraceae bacterium]